MLEEPEQNPATRTAQYGEPPVDPTPQHIVDEKIAEENRKIQAQQRIALEQKHLEEVAKRQQVIRRNKKIFIVTGIAAFLLIAGAIAALFLANRNNVASTIEPVNDIDIAKDNTVVYTPTDVNKDGTVDENEEIVSADQYAVEEQTSTTGSSDGSNREDSELMPEEILTEEESRDLDPTDEPAQDEIVETENDAEPSTNTEPENGNEEAAQDDEFNFSEASDEGGYATPTTATPIPAAPEPKPNGSTFTIASWNTFYTNSPSNVAKGAKAIAGKADIIGFQELNFASRRDAVKKALVSCSGCSYSGYFPDASGSGWGTKATLSLVWKKSRFTLLKSGTLSVLGPGAYGANTSNKWVNWVKLKDKTTGKAFYFLNTHLVASVESQGKPAGATSHLKNYAAHMDKLVGLINQFKKEKVPVFVSGDFNVNYRKDSQVQYKNFPYARLGGIGVKSGWQLKNLSGISKSTGTSVSSTRLIDYVFSLKHSSVYSESISVASSGYGSDHRAAFHKVMLAK